MGNAYDYKGKLISVEQALSKIKTDDCIVSALGAAEPNGLLDQLHTIAPRVTNVAVSTCLPMRPFKWFMDPAMQGHIEHQPFADLATEGGGVGPQLAAALALGLHQAGVGALQQGARRVAVLWKAAHPHAHRGPQRQLG